MGRTFTGTDNGNAGSGASVDALGTGAFTQIHLIRRLTTDAANQVIACKPFAGATGWAFILDNSPAAGVLRLRVCRATTNTDYIGDTGSAIAQNTTQWVAAVYGSGSASRILKRGLAAGTFTEIGYSLSQAGSGAYNADNAANLLTGNAAGGTSSFSGNIYVSAFFPSALTNAEIQEWCDKQRPSMFSPTAWWYYGLADPETDQSGNGITLDITGTSTVADVETPYVITSSQIADTETPSDQTNYLKYSAAARIEYTLGGAATEVDVAMHNTYDSATFGGEDAVGVWHKASGRIVPRYLGTIYAGGSLGGAASNAYRGSLTGLTLASGDKITLLAGCRQKTGLTGTWPVTARFWNSASPVTATVTTPTTPDLRTVFVGYSTLMESASPQHERAWPMKYRLADGNEQRVFLDQKGGLSLFDEGQTSGARTTYANRLAAFNGRLYVMDHGDFVTDQWSASDYQTALQDLCEKLLAATPTTTKILLYQVHILGSADEGTPNSFGNVAEDYRVAIRNVVATIASSRLTTIDHSKIAGWVNATDTSDGRHPTDGGHVKIYNFTVPTIQRLLGLAPGVRQVRALDLPLPLRLKWYPPRNDRRAAAIAASGATNLATGLSTETDTSVARTFAKQLATSVAAETDTALSRSLTRSVATGQSSETDAALARSLTKALAAGASAETDAALAPSLTSGLTTGTSTETDAAVARALSKRLAIGQATEAEAALPLDLTSGLTPGASAETDTAFAVTRFKRIAAPGIAAESDTAAARALQKQLSAAVSIETSVALALTLSRALGTGRAAETDSALALRFPLATGRATETDAAFALTLSGSLPTVAPTTGVWVKASTPSTGEWVKS